MQVQPIEVNIISEIWTTRSTKGEMAEIQRHSLPSAFPWDRLNWEQLTIKGSYIGTLFATGFWIAPFWRESLPSIRTSQVLGSVQQDVVSYEIALMSE